MANVSSSNGIEKYPQLRFNGYNNPWATQKLGDLGTFIKGAPLSKADISNEGNPFILYGELYTTYSEVTHSVKRKTDKTVEQQFYSKIGDVIMPTSGETPEDIATASCIMLPDVILAGDLLIYRTEQIDGRFVSYAIKNKVNKQISSVAQGKSVVHVRADELAKICITFPALDEQKKILNLLELLDTRIATQQSLIETLKKYKRGVETILFEGEYFKKYNSIRTCLGDVCSFFSGGTPSSSNSSYYGGNIPFIRSGEIHSENTELQLTELGLKNSAAKMVVRGDLLLALYGATSGEVDISKIDGAINQAILCIRPNTINKLYLKHLLSHNKTNIINTYLQGGQGNLSAEIIKGLYFDIPDLHVQNEVATILDALDERIYYAESQKSMLVLLKKGLLQQLFI